MTANTRNGARWTVVLILVFALCAGVYEAWLAVNDTFFPAPPEPHPGAGPRQRSAAERLDVVEELIERHG